MDQDKDLTAVIADDHELFRAALAEILKRDLGFTKVIEASSLDEAIGCLASNCDVTFVSLDLSMPGMEGQGSLHGIREVYPDLRLAVVSGSERREDILAALAAGVHGYIPKTLRISQIASAVRTVIEGNIFVPAILSHQAKALPLAPEPRRPADVGRKAPALSPRQADVLALMAEGKSNKEIARELNVAEGTVKVHVNALFRVLGAHNRMSAVAAMSRYGWAQNSAS